jgi:hypothetical protein
MAYDAARRVMVLFSGFREDASPPLSDTWTWDGCRWAPHPTSSSPPGRSFGGMAFDAARANVVLFGGGTVNLDKFVNDTWTWDGQAWTERHPTTVPPPMITVNLAYDKTNGVVVLVGQTLMGDATTTWTWNGQNWTLKQPAHSPGPREYAAVGVGAGSLLCFGGTSAFGDLLNDLWAWDGRDWGQVQLKKGPAGGPGRMARDEARSNVLLIEHDGTWTLKGLVWTHHQPAASPPSLIFGALAYDGATGQVISFGGQSVSNQLSAETWAWDGASWTAR